MASPSRIRATTACGPSDIDMAVPFLSRSGAGERFQEAAPVACAVEDGAHLIATCPVSIQAPMFQLNACTVLAVRDEAHLDFRFQRCVILPVGDDIPREHQTRVRCPREYAAPLTRASIVPALIPAAPDTWLDQSIHGIRVADFVGCQRPSRIFSVNTRHATACGALTCMTFRTLFGSIPLDAVCSVIIVSFLWLFVVRPFL